MKVNKFSIGEAIKFGWDKVKSNIILFAGIIIISILINAVTKNDEQPLILIFGLFLNQLISLGFVNSSLKITDNFKIKFDDFFSCYPLFLKYLIGSILYILMVYVGLILLIVPGIILAIRFQFYAYFIIDKEIGPIDALKKSFSLTNGALWQLLIFDLLLVCINIIGLLALILGLFVTIPLTSIANAFVYRKLMNQTKMENSSVEITENHELQPEPLNVELPAHTMNVELPVHTMNVELPMHTLILEIKNNFNKDPISKVKISLSNDVDDLESISDIDGKVIFGKITEGVYKLNINSNGFEEYSKDIIIDKNDKITVELKGEASLKISVLDIVNEVGISDALVKINDKELKTDTNGVANIPDIEFGSCEISITKDSYKQETLSVEVTGGQQETKVFLKPDIELSEEFANKAVNIQNSLKEAMNKLSSACDMGIPGYYKGICLELIKFNESVASTPAYVYSEQSNEKIEALYTITGQICKEIEVVLTNSENITEYISIADKGIKSIPEISINPSDYDSMVQAYFNNPGDFVLDSKPGILNKLQETDAEITKNIQVFNINPVAHLWGISQIIVSGEKNEYEEGASLLLINILLDNTRKMFESNEIVKRLKNPL